MGDWVLLDEVNLAPSDTLQRLSGLLDATSMGDGGLCLTERGDVDTLVGAALCATPRCTGANTFAKLASALQGACRYGPCQHCAVLVCARVCAVARQVIHPNFRLFAAMNPPTDVGKKELPTALRNRFTEVLVLRPHCCCIGRPAPFSDR